MLKVYVVHNNFYKIYLIDQQKFNNDFDKMKSVLLLKKN